VRVRRDAWRAPRRTVASSEAVGCVSASLVCPYPPGIPLLVPGERIDEATVRALEEIHAVGGTVAGLRGSGPGGLSFEVLVDAT